MAQCASLIAPYALGFPDASPSCAPLLVSVSGLPTKSLPRKEKCHTCGGNGLRGSPVIFARGRGVGSEEAEHESAEHESSDSGDCCVSANGLGHRAGAGRLCPDTAGDGLRQPAPPVVVAPAVPGAVVVAPGAGDYAYVPAPYAGSPAPSG